ncbi:hypothetical protein [Nonomuraea sp. NPDC046570]|uniref:hypothetical protein n=1 Tax=Nonomuraea sp. NPDC046570 TaxID=3155255 RepID=UPI003402CC70
MNLRVASSKSWGALVLGLLSLVLRLDLYESSSVNGQVVSCSNTDLGGIGLGGLAVIVGLAAGWDAATGLIRYQAPARKGPTLVVMAFALALGTVGLLKGFSVIMDPCG